jgi:hypothetical protein
LCQKCDNRRQLLATNHLKNRAFKQFRAILIVAVAFHSACSTADLRLSWPALRGSAVPGKKKDRAFGPKDFLIQRRQRG